MISNKYFFLNDKIKLNDLKRQQQLTSGEAGWGRQDCGEAQHQPHRGPHQAGDHGQVRYP